MYYFILLYNTTTYGILPRIGVQMVTITTSKGQIVIPSAIRRKLGIQPGTRIQVDLDENARLIILTPITREYIHSLRGKFKGKKLLQALAEEKQREKEA